MGRARDHVVAGEACRRRFSSRTSFKARMPSPVRHITDHVRSGLRVFPDGPRPPMRHPRTTSRDRREDDMRNAWIWFALLLGIAQILYFTHYGFP